MIADDAVSRWLLMPFALLVIHLSNIQRILSKIKSYRIWFKRIKQKYLLPVFISIDFIKIFKWHLALKLKSRSVLLDFDSFNLNLALKKVLSQIISHVFSINEWGKNPKLLLRCATEKWEYHMNVAFPTKMHNSSLSVDLINFPLLSNVNNLQNTIAALFW